MWTMVLACGAILAVTTGLRLSLGLFVQPLAQTGLGIATVSLVFAVGQFCWGVTQPLFGALSERIGTARVLVLGALLLAAGLALAPLMLGTWGLMLTLGVVSAGGAGAGSFAILIGGTAQQLPPEKRTWAGGLINAGGSIGQLIFAPLTQAAISVAGWANAMWLLAAVALGSATLAVPAAGRGRPPAADQRTVREYGLNAMMRIAFADRSYWLVHLAFFTCGFHIAFLVTHLPGEVALCGLPVRAGAMALGLIGLMNIVGTVGVGWLGGRMRLKGLLVALYSSRAVAIMGYLMAPKSLLTLYVFAAVLGVTWLATVPPTAGLVGKLFGTRHLATLFGLTLLSHQIGAFFGAWLGGVAMAMTGSYLWVWYLDMGLALLAAVANLPIRESPVRAPVPAPA
jgi:MFS family permease